MKNNYFEIVEDFSIRSLSAWQKNELFICETSIPVIGGIVRIVRVKNNKQSQRTVRHPNGHILFDDGRRFDIAGQSIDGIRVWLVRSSDRLHAMWETQLAVNEVEAALGGLTNVGDLQTLLALIWEVSGRPKPGYWKRHIWYLSNGRRGDDLRREVSNYLPLLSLPTLRNLAALLASGTGSLTLRAA